MSIEAMSWAMKQTAVENPAARHVLLILANYAGQDGEDAFPSVERIARITGLSVRAVQYKLRELEAIGVIRKGNQAILSAKNIPADRRPICYSLNLRVMRKSEVQEMQPESANGVQMTTERGANDDVTGCKPCTQTIQEPSSKPSKVNVRSQAKARTHFDDFWDAWPKYRHVNKKGARAAFDRAVKRAGGVAPIADGLNRALTVWPTDEQDDRCRLVPHPTTWLNQDRFNDPIEAVRTTFAGGGNGTHGQTYKPMPRGTFCNLDDPLGEL